MLYSLCSVALTLWVAEGLSDVSKHKKCLVRDPNAVHENIPPHLENEKPTKKYPNFAALPTSLDWRERNGKVFASWNRNQHIPDYCGSCWAFAATSALNDRIAINNVDHNEVALAPQVLLDCELRDDGCHGGEPDNAYEYIMQKGITEESCANYVAQGHDYPWSRKCTEESVCANCAPNKGCWAQYPYRLWKVLAHGTAKGERQMIQSLQDGPIVCGLAFTDEFHNYVDTFYIMNDTTGNVQQDHAISIVGYGEEKGRKYWIGRNSWGTWWGKDGYFRLARGSNSLGIEEWCSWATPPRTYQWVNGSKDAKAKAPPKYRREAEIPESAQWMKYGGPVIKRPTPEETVDDRSLPEEFRWDNVNGTNFLTVLRNQHVPTYCGSCWAFGTTSMLSDRINIQRVRAGKSMYPEINLAPQVLINKNGGGSCNGGNPIAALNWIHNYGIPDETCQVYQAKNNPHGSTFSAMNICFDCVPGDTPDTFTPGTCSAVDKGVFDKYYVGQYGPVIGANSMKKEIFSRGPIGCGVSATDKFDAYTGGIYSEWQFMPRINHAISVVGWGVEDGVEYWVGRNSWGTYWGEEGFFRMKMWGDNLGIELECNWGVPTLLEQTVDPAHVWKDNVQHFP